MAVASAQEYIDLLVHSGLLSGEELQAAKELGERSADAKTLASALVKRAWLTRWQAIELLGKNSALTLGKYHLLEPLRVNDICRVYLAKHPEMDRRVEVGVLRSQVAQDKRACEQFLHQARQFASLDHPNLVHIFDVDEAEGRHFVVMEHADGHSLEKIVEQRGPLAFDVAADCVRQAGSALSQMHAQNAAHGDLSPSNLWLNPQGRLKLLNSAAALSTAESDGEGPPSSLADFRSPEQSAGKEPTAAGDLYSLGCTLYFLLSGRPPFAKGTYEEKLKKHRTAKPPALSELRADVPEPLAEICQKLMAKNPEARFPSADALGEAIDEWLQSRPATARKTLKGRSSGATMAAAAEASPKSSGGIKVAAPLEENAANGANGASTTAPNTESQAAVQDSSSEVLAPVASTAAKAAKAAKAVNNAAPDFAALAAVTGNGDGATAEAAEGLATSDETASADEPKSDLPDFAALAALGAPKTAGKKAAAKGADAKGTSVKANGAKASRAKGKAKAGKAAKEKGVDETGDSKAAPARSKKKSNALIYALAGGGLLVVGLLAGLAYVFLNGKGESSQEVAKAPTNAEQSAAAGSETTDEGTTATAAPANEAAATAPGAATSAQTPGAVASPAAAPGTGDGAADLLNLLGASGDTPTPPAQGAAPATAANPPAASAGANQVAAATPAPAPAAATPAAATPAPTTPAPPSTPTPAPAAQKPPESKPAEPAAPAASAPPAEPVKPKEPEKKPPAKPQEPFAQLAKVKAVTLPPIPKDGSAEPLNLGRVLDDPDARFVVTLVGGGEVLKGKHTLMAQAAEEAAKNRKWNITLGQGEDAASRTAIATVALESNDLKFQWTPEAASKRDAGMVRNCVLKLDQGRASHAIALREPKIVAPMPLGSDKRSARGGALRSEAVEIDDPPEGKELQIENP